MSRETRVAVKHRKGDKAMAKQRCEERVYKGGFPNYQCQKLAVVQRGDKWFCRVHDPEYIAEKNAKKNAALYIKWDREKAETARQQRRVRIEALIYKDFDTAFLEKHAQAIRQFIESLNRPPTSPQNQKPDLALQQAEPR